MSTTAPPSPKATFPVGHSFAYIRDPLAFLTRCAREHGDVVRLRLGYDTYYCLNHPTLVEEVLRERADTVVKDRLTRDLNPIVGQGLLISEGAFWRRQRKLAQPAFQHKAIERYGEVMVEHALRLRDEWQDGQARDIHADMMRLALGVVAKTLFNSDVADESRGVAEAIEVMMAYFLKPAKFLPFRAWLPTRENREFRAAIQQVDEVIFGIIRRRRAGSDDPGDLLSRLLAARDDEGSGMTDQQLRDECVTLFLAGHETTAQALTFAFYLLAHNPDAADRLAAELDSVLNGRPPTANDVCNLVYTNWVVRETMRLYPPAWVIGRQAVEDFELGGYPIRKGVQFLISQWVLHRDPRWWDEAEAFRPERWDNDLGRRLPKGTYIPFGDGPRVCIGNHFALMEAVLLLATLAQTRRVEAVPGQVLEINPSITLRPRAGTRMMIRARKS